jgi:hypothetical protein
LPYLPDKKVDAFIALAGCNIYLHQFVYKPNQKTENKKRLPLLRQPLLIEIMLRPKIG